MTTTVYDLAAHPEHILPMREEVERVTAEQGWTKDAIGNMHKLDSFIRESQRLGSAPPRKRIPIVQNLNIPFIDFLSSRNVA